MAADADRVAVGYGLRIGLLDARDPAALRLLSELGPFGAAAEGMVLRGDLLAVVDVVSGLRLIDVSDPTQPRPLSSTKIPDQARDLALAGDFAFVAADGAGLFVFDISDPNTPVQVGSLPDIGKVQQVLVEGPTAYLAADEAGVLVLDLSRADAPSLLGQWNPKAPVRNIAFANGHVLAVDDLQLAVLDVANPRQPREVGRLITHGIDPSTRLVGNGDTIYVAAQGLLPIDLSDPTQPTLGASAEAVHGGRVLAVDGDRVYLGSSRLAGLSAYDVGQDLLPKLLSQYTADDYGDVWELAAEGDRLYIQGRAEVVALDLGAGTPTGQRLPGLHAQGPMVAHQGLLYLGQRYTSEDEPGIVVVDARIPDQWRQIATSTALTSVDELAVASDILAGLGAPDGSGRMWVQLAFRAFELIQPATLVPGATLDLQYNPTGMDLSQDGHWAYVTEGVWDVDVCCFPPPHLHAVALDHGSVPKTSSAQAMDDTGRDVAVDGKQLYVVTGEAGLLIYDLSDPGHPKASGALKIGSDAQVVQPLGGQAVVGYADGVRWLDVSVPDRPRVLATYRLDSDRIRLAVAGRMVWVALGHEGLLGLKMEP